MLCLLFWPLLAGSPLELAAQGRQAQTAKPRRFFSNSSFWNQALPANPEIDPRNAEFVQWLASDPTPPFGINLRTFTIPVYAVDEKTPRYNIQKHTLTERERATWKSQRETFGHGPGFGRDVPIPPEAVPDPENDAHFAVVDWKTGWAWDMWRFSVRKDGTYESNTGMKYRIDGDGLFHTKDFSVVNGESIHFHGPSRAAGVPAIAGLIMYDEIKAGEIRHKLACAISRVALQEFVFPAAWTDGGTPGGIPEGAVIQLDPKLDLTKFNLLPGEIVVAKALQKYGAVLVDSAGGNTLYAEGLWGHKGRSWDGILRDHKEGGGFKTIPVQHYRVLKLPPVVKMGDARKIRTKPAESKKQP